MNDETESTVPAAYLSVWRRTGATDRVVLPLPAFRGDDVAVAPLFPAQAAGWEWTWDAGAGELTVTVSMAPPTARVLSVTRALPT